jgi:hypothetical protein
VATAGVRPARLRVCDWKKQGHAHRAKIPTLRKGATDVVRVTGSDHRRVELQRGRNDEGVDRMER